MFSSVSRFTAAVIFSAGFLFSGGTIFGQGCVIARGGGAGGACMPGETELSQSKWQITVAHRWFRSDRHFVGRVEQKHRQEQGTEVVNDSNYVDATLSYAYNDRWSFNLVLPYSWHDRSSLYEHLGNSSGQRFHTQSKGLGDIRVTANRWLFDPKTSHKGNVLIGVGIKAPTGDDEATDIFIRSTGPTLRYVDSSIQPGDGGWGASLEATAFRRFADGFLGYFNGFYLFNPETRNLNTNFSIPDAYMVRTGINWSVPNVKGLSISIGPRWEGVPSRDAFGHSAGSRRPGYSIAVEPGITYHRGKVSATLTVPVAIEHNRQRTYRARTTGDAAFADYTINSSISIGL
jgi:hypothetical protein